MKPGTAEFPGTIKWSRNLKRRLAQGRHESFQASRIVAASYRPFSRRLLYQSDLFIDEAGTSAYIFLPGASNSAICFSDVGSRTDYCVLAIDGLADLHFGAAVDAYQQVPRFRYASGERLDNITDWALDQFRAHYKGSANTSLPPEEARSAASKDNGAKSSQASPKGALDPSRRGLKASAPQGEGTRKTQIITKDAIFHYAYGVLHDPIYREKYALNLKREFPRIPFYANFWKWAGWGEKLMTLHIGYETVESWPLERIDAPEEKSRKGGLPPKAMLRANKDSGSIQLDSETQLAGVPPQAWTYRLGNRSALEWILDQYKEKTPKDPTIREKFNTYRFVDHTEKVIDLLKRVTRVSVETMKIIEAMRAEKR